MASLDKNLFIKFNHLTDDFIGDSTILGASQKALSDGIDSINSLVINTSNGVIGGGEIGSNLTFEVDDSVVRTTRNIVTGSGLKGGGNLSADRNLTVDGTVLRTSSLAQTKDGELTLNGKMTVSNDLVTTGLGTFNSNIEVLGEISGNNIYAHSNLAINFDDALFDPEAPFHVNGDAVVEGTLLAKEDVQIESDRRIKDEIIRIENPLQLLKNINGYTYVLKNKERKNRHMGLIAQEVIETIPEAVRESASGVYSVAYHNLIGVLVEAIKVLEERCITNEQKIEQLQQDFEQISC